MASGRNDALVERTVEGSVNFYDGQKVRGTATDKGLAARMGGHNYNIISGKGKEEIYFRDMRNGDHFVDRKNRHTAHMFGSRRRRCGRDDGGGQASHSVKECLKAPRSHGRDELLADRRLETQLAQTENPQSWAGFQARTGSLWGQPKSSKRYTIDNQLYANEAPKLFARTASKAEFLSRRGEPMVHSTSAPSLSIERPETSLRNALRADARKLATQHQTESANFGAQCTVGSQSMFQDEPGGSRCAFSARHCSVNRLEPGDFSVTRKNNHYSSVDKLTRSDPYFMRPRPAATNNSVKYDIINNERKWFRY